MARPSSGCCESHVPTAKTVTCAPWSPRIWSARCVSDGSPAPWKVSATAGAEVGPRRTSGPGVRRIAGTAAGAPAAGGDPPGDVAAPPPAVGAAVVGDVEGCVVAAAPEEPCDSGLLGE